MCVKARAVGPCARPRPLSPDSVAVNRGVEHLRRKVWNLVEDPRPVLSDLLPTTKRAVRMDGLFALVVRIKTI